MHIQYIRELLDNGVLLALLWTDTRDMLGDGMTKGVVDRSGLHAVMDGQVAVDREVRMWMKRHRTQTINFSIDTALQLSVSGFYCSRRLVVWVPMWRPKSGVGGPTPPKQPMGKVGGPLPPTQPTLPQQPAAAAAAAAAPLPRVDIPDLGAEYLHGRIQANGGAFTCFVGLWVHTCWPDTFK